MGFLLLTNSFEFSNKVYFDYFRFMIICPIILNYLCWIKVFSFHFTRYWNSLLIFLLSIIFSIFAYFSSASLETNLSLDLGYAGLRSWIHENRKLLPSKFWKPFIFKIPWKLGCILSDLIVFISNLKFFVFHSVSIVLIQFVFLDVL